MQIALGISPTISANVAASFTPASISGLQLWLDASDSSSLFQDSGGTTPATADGDPVGRWADKSVNGSNGNQGDGTKKPVLKTAVKNGKNGIRFDGVNDLLEGTVGIGNGNERTIFAVLNFTNVDGSEFMVVSRPTGFLNRFLIRQAKNGSDIASQGIHIASDVTTTNVYVTGSSVLVNAYALFTWRQTSSTRAIRFFRNGAELTPVIETVLSFTGENNGYFIGTYLEGFGWYFKGDACEIIVYNRELTDTEKSKVDNYLNSKWSIY